MSKLTILVTGGAGFIGSHLVDSLLAQGHQVRVLDNFSTGKLSNLPRSERLTVIEGDIADAELVASCVAGCDAVAHLAAVASVQASVEQPLATHQSNFIGTLNVCEAMRQHQVKRVIFASSAAVYGNNGEGEAISESLAKQPLTPYASDKLASEYYLEFYQREHQLEPVIFRFFNIYGPRQDPSSPYSGVISIFTERAKQQLPITVFGDGEQTRDFVFVSDLVKILQAALEVDAIPSGGAINVGLGGSVSLNQLLQGIEQALQQPLNVSYGSARAGDIKHSLANNQRLQYYFPLTQPISIEQGLAELLKG